VEDADIPIKSGLHAKTAVSATIFRFDPAPILAGIPERNIKTILSSPIPNPVRLEPPLRQIIDVLQQVMCTHDAEKLAISVLEIYEEGYREEGSSK
jgi:hypothetical protein